MGSPENQKVSTLWKNPWGSREKTRTWSWWGWWWQKYCVMMPILRRMSLATPVITPPTPSLPWLWRFAHCPLRHNSRRWTAPSRPLHIQRQPRIAACNPRRRTRSGEEQESRRKKDENRGKKSGGTDEDEDYDEATSGEANNASDEAASSLTEVTQTTADASVEGHPSDIETGTSKVEESQAAERAGEIVLRQGGIILIEG